MRKRRNIQARLTAREKEMVKTLAKADGLTVSEWLRKAIRKRFSEDICELLRKRA